MAKGKKLSAVELATSEATSKGVSSFELAALASSDAGMQKAAIERLKALGVSAASILALGGQKVPAKQDREVASDDWTGDQKQKMRTIGFASVSGTGKRYVRGWSFKVGTLTDGEIDKIIELFEAQRESVKA